MSIKHLQSLLERLNDHCADMLDAAAGFASARTHYEVAIEHLMIKLLEDGRGDLARIMNVARLDSDTLWHGMLAQLQTLRAGNSGKPSFSPFMLQWFEQAWVITSLHYGQQQIRSIALLDALIDMASRLPGNHFALLDGISQETLRRDWRALTEGSIESRSATRTAATGATQGSAPVAAGDASALAQFTIDVTARARDGKIDPVFGRDNEIRQMVDILCRRRKNNPILVGDPGVGKTALVEGLALRIAQGTVPEALRKVALHILDLGLLQAGAGVRGEFEKRLKNVLDEVRASPTPIILFIDEAHTLIGAGGNEGGGDAANLLKPALARGELRTIAATTWSEYKKYFERDAALARRFQQVKIEEPDLDTAIVMLSGLKPWYEEHHDVLITDEAIEAAVKLSARYISGRQLPDKAIDLIDTAAARVRMGQASPPAAIEQAEAMLAHIERRLGHLKREAAQGILPSAALIDALHAEKQRLHEEVIERKLRWQIELSLVNGLETERRKGDAERNPAALERARSDLKVQQGATPLVHPEVNAEVVAQVVSDWTGVPAGNMIKDLATALLAFEEKMSERVVGQDGAQALIGKSLRARVAGLSRTDAPMGVFLLVGPSGVGKTETARALAELLFGGERFLITINMSEYQEAHTVSQLKGSPPGYVGYGEGGILTEAVRQRPYSVVLLDEIEKAHPDVASLFYQVFDRGFMRDGEGREIDFRNTVILMTSNLGSERILALAEEAAEAEPAVAAGEPVADPAADETPAEPAARKSLSLAEIEQAIQPHLLSHFAQALLARMQVVPFLPLDQEALRAIVTLKLDKVAERMLATHGVELRVTPGIVERLAALCNRPELGARHVEALIDRQLMPEVARQLLSFMVDGHVPPVAVLGLDGHGGLVCDFFEREASRTREEPAPQLAETAG